MRTRLAPLSLTLLVAACGGGGGGDDGVASLRGDAAAEESTTTSIDPEDAMLAFARCMREQGVDFPDPSTDGGFAIDLGDLGVSEDELHEAEEACEEHAPRMGRVSEAEAAEMEQRLREMAECLRDRGWDVPDPEIRIAGQAGGPSEARDDESGTAGGPPEIPIDDPEFRSDQRECADEVGMEPPTIRGRDE